MTAPPVHRLAQEVDPDSDLGYYLHDPSPQAQIDWAERFLTIPNERGRVVKFIARPQQRLMAENDTGKDITIKGRQTTASSWFIAKRVRRFTNGSLFGANCLIAADKEQTTALFRERIKHHLNDLGRHGFKFDLRVDNDEELVIAGLENRWMFASGQQKTIGRSYASPEVHISEFAHWPENTAMELLGDVLPGVPNPPHGHVDIESTPDGATGAFYEMSMGAKPLNPDSLWTVRFYPWWTEPRYQVAPLGSGIYADIEVTPERYNQLTEGFAPTMPEMRLMNEKGLTIPKILWRRIRKAEQDMTPAPFAQEYPEDFETCWLGHEGRYFDTPDDEDHLEYYRETKRDPVRFFEKLTWNGAEILFYGHNLALWELPRPGQQYVVWGDAAGGSTTKDSDFTCFVIMNIQTRAVAARARLKCAPKHAGGILCAIGNFFNMAMAGGERSAHGETMLQEAKDLGYPNLYYHVEPNKKPDLGIYPTPANREKLLEKFKEGVIHHEFASFDPIGIQEMATFTWQSAEGRLKAQAVKGQHDDWIMAAAGAWFILDKASMRYNRRRRQAEVPETLIVGKGGRVVIGRERRQGLNQVGPHKPWFW